MKLLRPEYLLLLFIWFGLSVAFPPQPCPEGCNCPSTYKPVCGTDNTTYSNICYLSCATQANPNVKYCGDGECPKRGSGNCDCIPEYNPVCGSDGKTYWSKCLLYCAKKKNHKLYMVSKGMCETDTTTSAPPVCRCTKERNRVCASNGETFQNPCLLECAMATDDTLEFLYSGKCTTVPSTTACTCIPKKLEVCANTGVTYWNKCYLKCAMMTDDTGKLALEYKGKCTTPASTTAFVCPKKRKEVCANTGETFWNKCYLECAILADETETLEYAYKGRCTTMPPPPTTPKPCTCHKKPRECVCGSNGNTYRNPCELRCAMQTDDALEYSYHGRCTVPPPTTTRPPCDCSRKTKHVCATNGKTYKNRCHLDYESDYIDESIEFSYCGPCTTTAPDTTPKVCRCKNHRDCLCATNGITYRNRCYLRCAMSSDDSIDFDYSGRCTTIGPTTAVPDTTISPCGCPPWGHPVCGSNGKTYQNDCTLRCACKIIPDLNIAYHGECTTVAPTTVVSTTISPCGCPPWGHPVCGSDGKTYPNDCTLRCACKIIPDLNIAYHGECTTVAPTTVAVTTISPCGCTNHWRPVCGSDNRTHINRCHLRCACKKQPELTMLYEGKCGSPATTTMSSVTVPVCTCPHPHHSDWVCGTDGEDYRSLCLLKCTAKDEDNPDLKMKYRGHCTTTPPPEVTTTTPEPPCSCPPVTRRNHKKKVCDSEGTEHESECHFNCARRKNQNLWIEKNGPCGY